MALVYNEHTGMFDEVSNSPYQIDAKSLRNRLTTAESQLTSMQKELQSERQKSLLSQNRERRAEKEIDELNASIKHIHLFYIILVGVLLFITYCQYEGKTVAESSNNHLNTKVYNLEYINKQLNNRVDDLQFKNNQLEASNNELSSALNIVKSNMPLILGKVSVRNENENYDSWIYSRNTTYINPKVELYSLIDANVDIYVRLYTPNGILSKGSSSPYGYSYGNRFYVKKNQKINCTFSGWGGSDKGHWKPGLYRFEFYYSGKCIGEKSFTIY